MRRIALVLALLLPALAVAAPVQAGGWAATYLDPVPATFAQGTTYTVGFWMLQHGTHPYEGAKLGKVGLKFTSGAGSLEFTGVQLKEKGHYAAAIALPAGDWRVEAIQGWFAPFPVGTLKVPGALTVKPLDSQLKGMIAHYLDMNGGKDPWGEVRPPGFTRKGAAVKPAAAAASVIVAAPAPVPAAREALPYWLGFGVAAAAGLTFLVVRRRVRA
ncbi:hypothetical protein AB0B45_06420 [Nonomuraea sp. NPDC049152]|uniref:hypothetical protein n=1 Tax=Nonomuraea sp. NPDC049152 TaxID=3154350 RepID=UPI0033F7B5C5